MPDAFAGLPCTDADVAVYASGDFPALTARCERVASGADGSIPAASSVLTTATPLEARGVQPGHVLVIDKYTGTDTRGNPKEYALGDALPVLAVSGNTVTLGRFGLAAGQGALPAGVTETTGASGLSYYVPSLSAQIVADYADVTDRLQAVTDLSTVDPETVKVLTVYSVLRSLYFAASRVKDDPFERKYEALEERIAARIKTLSRRDVLLAPSFGALDTGFAASDGLWPWC